MRYDCRRVLSVPGQRHFSCRASILYATPVVSMRRRYVIKNQSSEAKQTSGVTRDLRPGDRVMGFTRFGAFSTHVNVPRSFVRKMPEEWSFEQGASFLVQACFLDLTNPPFPLPPSPFPSRLSSAPSLSH
jgi:hypothetical protein